MFGTCIHEIQSSKSRYCIAGFVHDEFIRTKYARHFISNIFPVNRQIFQSAGAVGGQPLGQTDKLNQTKVRIPMSDISRSPPFFTLDYSRRPNDFSESITTGCSTNGPWHRPDLRVWKVFARVLSTRVAASRPFYKGLLRISRQENYLRKHFKVR